MNRPLLFLLLSAVASSQQYVMSTFAGGGPPVTPVDAPTVAIGDPPRVAVDSAGNTYFGSLHSLFKVDRRGSLLRIAGTGRAGVSGDGGPATAAQLNSPVGIAVNAAGTVFYTERDGNLIRSIAADGSISTLPVEGLSTPMGLAFDAAGNLYVADMRANSVRKIAPGGEMTTVAGNGLPEFSGDGGPAVSASLKGPEGVAVDAGGNVYIADTFNHRVRVVARDGSISTLAGNGFPGFSGDNGDATSASMFLPTDVAVDAAGNVYIADLGNSRIRKVANGIISTIAGNSGGLPPRDGLSATAVRLSGPTGIAVDAGGAVYIAEGSIGSGSGLDGGDFRIWRVEGGKIATAAGTGQRSFSGDGGSAALAQFDTPASLARDSAGNLYIADSRNNRIRKIATDGTVTTVAGNVLPGFSGDNGPATTAELNGPTGVAVDADGNLFIADTGNNRIRLVYKSTGIIGTLAGNGNTAYFGDGGNSLKAALNRPRGVAVDEAGTVYIADTGNHRVRRVIFAIIDTVAGGLNAPSEVAVDSEGSLYVADAGDGSVRKFSKGSSQVTPLAGARGVTIDSFGNVYASGANRVVKILSDGSTLPVAGTGQCCYSGDGGPAAAARLNGPWGLAADASGNLYIADTGNDAIRLATASASSFFIRSITNGASNQADPVAPGEIVTLYGVGLGPGTLQAAQPSDGVLPKSIGGTSVLFNGIPAALLYAAAGQVSAIVPYSVGGASVQVVVKADNVSTQPFPLSVAAAAPGIFTNDSTGTGQARALNADGSSNGPTRPALVGTTLTLFATGEGQTSPAGADGRITGATAAQPVLPVRVTIGGRTAGVQSAGGVAGVTAGVMQVVVTVPTGVTGQLPVQMTVGNASSQSGVTVWVQ